MQQIHSVPMVVMFTHTHEKQLPCNQVRSTLETADLTEKTCEK